MGYHVCFFLRRSSSSGSRVIASEVENCQNPGKSGTFYIGWPLETWPLTWPQKWQSTFVMIYLELSNAACRASLHSPGAELGGGVKTPPPALHGNLRPSARRGLSQIRFAGKIGIKPELRLLWADTLFLICEIKMNFDTYLRNTFFSNML